jgi:hypothetical protein
MQESLDLSAMIFRLKVSLLFPDPQLLQTMVAEVWMPVIIIWIVIILATAPLVVGMVCQEVE